MTESERDRLFKAWADSLSRATPQLDPRVRQRVLAAHARAGKPSAFPAPYRWALGGFAVAVTAAVLLVLRAPAAPSFQVAGHPAQVGAWLTSQPTAELALRFSEGTLVALGKGSRGRVTEVARGGARIELQHGSVDAEVAHLPGANWTFGAGPFEVAVTGTHLDVSWAPETGKFELSVSRGAVVVQGPFIQGPQEVRAGQVCRVDVTRRLMELGQLSQPTPTTAEVAPEAPDVPTAAPAESAAPPTAGRLEHRTRRVGRVVARSRSRRAPGRPPRRRTRSAAGVPQARSGSGARGAGRLFARPRVSSRRGCTMVRDLPA